MRQAQVQPQTEPECWVFTFSGTLQTHVWYNAASDDRRLPDSKWQRVYSNTWGRWVWFKPPSLRQDDCPLVRAMMQPVTPPEALSEVTQMPTPLRLVPVGSPSPEAVAFLASSPPPRGPAVARATSALTGGSSVDRVLFIERSWSPKRKCDAEDVADVEPCRDASPVSLGAVAATVQPAALNSTPTPSEDTVSDSSSSASTSSDHADGSSSSRDSNFAEEVQPMPTIEEKIPEEQMQFWTFVKDAIAGSACGRDEYWSAWVQDYALGGLGILLPDALAVAHRILVPHSENVGEQIWRAMIVIYLGCGGPGMATYSHIAHGTALNVKGTEIDLPKKARLPSLQKASDKRLKRMYGHLKKHAEIHRASVLSGDGSAVKMRFYEGKGEDKKNAQGLPVLVSWRDAVQTLISKATVEGSPSFVGNERVVDGLQRLGAKAIITHFSDKSVKCFGELSIKELFTYMSLAVPGAFDSDVALPFGSGSRRGALIVIGSKATGMTLHQECRKFIKNIPKKIGEEIRNAAMAAMGALPDGLRNLPGIDFQREAPHCIKALDVEVCWCWYQGAKRASSTNSSAPASWHGFSRELWAPLE